MDLLHFKDSTSNRDVISLFSGAMGIDIGLAKAGLNVVVGQDFDPGVRCDHARKWAPECLAETSVKLMRQICWIWLDLHKENRFLYAEEYHANHFLPLENDWESTIRRAVCSWILSA